MAPTSSLARAALPPQQNPAAASTPGATATKAPAAEAVPQPVVDPPAPKSKKRSMVVFATMALVAALAVLLVSIDAIMHQLVSGHQEEDVTTAPPLVTMVTTVTTPSTTEGATTDNATWALVATSTTRTTVMTTSTTEEATTSSVESFTTSTPSTTAIATAGVGTASLRGSVKCYNFYSQLSVNPLQKNPENPDSEAFGFATCTLCTNGTARCTSLLHSGKTELIASHIHLAEGAGADGSTGEGPPVMNFCGSNAQGLIDDGADYSGPCEQWKDGAAHNTDSVGILVPNFNRGITAAERVEDIVKRPNMYFLNFHSLASWNHWYPHPRGMARGVLVLQGLAK